MANNNGMIFAVGFVGTMALGAIGFGFYKGFKKLEEIDNRINKTVDDVAKGVEVSVDDAIIREAVDKAVEREVKDKVERACQAAVELVQHDISASVDKAVKEKQEDLEADVEKEIRKQIGEIDISKAKEKVVREASERASEKFDNELNDILRSHKDTLSNVSKIYQSMADTIASPVSKAKEAGKVILNI